EPRRLREGGAGPFEAPLPVVRLRDCVGSRLVVGGEGREGAQPLPLGRGRLERPGEVRERAAARPAGDVVRLEERARLLPDRARLPGRALVAGRLPDEVEAPRRARAGGVEEVALAGDLVDAGEPRAASEGRADVLVE